MNKIKLSGVIPESTVDGPGFRYVLFTQGCTHNCKDCHNTETHPLEGGENVDIDEIIEDIKRYPYLTGVTLSGGDPIIQSSKLTVLGQKIKELGLNLIIYTGYTYDELMDVANSDNKIMELLRLTDILVDGKFDVDKRDLTLLFRGSQNQRPIDVKKSLLNKEIIVLSDDEFSHFFI